MDYRLKPNRRAYFDALYRMTLTHKISPGLVYLYLPELIKRMRLNDEEALWFAFINGITQNPITSLRIVEQLPSPSRSWQPLLSTFEEWFNENWATLSFDTDRQKNKRLTLAAISSYLQLVREAGSQSALYAGKTYEECWVVASQIVSFGRMSAFSYLEYVYLLGFGPDCTSLMFEDKDGSRSHRNGMLMLHGHDELVWDKRANNGCTGNYRNFPGMVAQMNTAAAQILTDFSAAHPEVPDVGNFTLESLLCQFKNSFFGRRYPGVYSDMAQERIQWYDDRGLQQYTQPFKLIREDNLPDWLRIEAQDDPKDKGPRAKQFMLTGVPYRAEHFL